MKKLKFEYRYLSSDIKENFKISAEGDTREELVEDLISKENPVAMYYFLRTYPELTPETKRKLKRKILEIAGVRTLKQMTLPLFANQRLSIVSENKEIMMAI